MKKPLDEILRPILEELKAAGLEWKVNKVEGPSTPYSIVNGKKVLMLGTNNYLGLSNHKKLKKAAIEAIKKYGAGSGSVRAISGTMDLHLKLEETIAKFKRTEAAIYFQTGFAANAGGIPQLLDQKSVVLSDELNHGSIIDGIRLAKVEKLIYKHCDMEDLENKLKEVSGKFEKIWIISDGVFSMDGDIAPLDKIYNLATEYGAYIWVDDAHGDGVLGEHGRGITSHYKLEGKIEVEMGTFSKAFGVVGGYVAGSKILKEYMHNKARTYLLSGSAPPATVASCIAALELLEEDERLVKKLWKNTNYFKRKIKKLGLNMGNSQTPIVPIMIGDSKKAKQFSEMLFEEGVFALPIVYPMVAQGKARIRTQIRADFKKADLDFALEKIEKIAKKLQVI
ncbi:MAG: glycine C-acetyltransferase [Candidatus Micrarchaeota archaeon]|nr:glycine C-acetyltransferase [Candidatus Micrarchaeota archaeon]